MTERPSKELISGPQLAMLIGLASIGMLFGALLLIFWTHRIHAPDPMDRIPPLLPSLATGLLAASSFFIHGSYRQLQSAEYDGFRRSWGIGALLGALFLVLQAGTWIRLHAMGVRIGSNFFATIFYVLTGFHALHVLAGLGALTWVWKNSQRLAQNGSVAPRILGWFWHFMDAVWVVLFAMLVLT